MTRSNNSILKYREGDFFVVPLRDGGHAIGLVARAGRRGKVLLGYFFGPRRSAPATLEDVQTYHPSDAVLVAIFGDLSLQQEEWPILGQREWDRNQWPMPAFGRVDALPGKLAWCVTYADDDPNTVVRESGCTPEQAEQLWPDGLFGAGAIEIKLTHILGSE